jgi:uncharacterized MAPEG superfamily protein
VSTDLTLLIWAVALTLVQSVIAVLGAQMQVGLPALASNRENLPPITGWADRAARAHRNMLENLVLFAALVLAAQVAGKANGVTAVGSELFFWARLVYVPVFLIGIPWVRTGMWAVSVVGLVMIIIQLL